MPSAEDPPNQETPGTKNHRGRNATGSDTLAELKQKHMNTNANKDLITDKLLEMKEMTLPNTLRESN